MEIHPEKCEGPLNDEREGRAQWVVAEGYTVVKYMKSRARIQRPHATSNVMNNARRGGMAGVTTGGGAVDEEDSG